MRILVTGAGGFLGRALMEHLARRHPRWGLHGLDRTRGRGPRRLQADLARPERVRALMRRVRPDVVFHLAGGTPALDGESLWKVHAEATSGLLEAVRSLPARRRPRIVSIGSAHEYGPAGGRPAREADRELPRGDYGFSKLAQTRLALAYAASGLDVVVARLFNVVSPDLPPHHALSSFCRQAARIESGRARTLKVRGDLDAERDFLDLDDAFRALVLLARRGKSGEVYNVCSGKPVRMRAALAAVRAMTRVPVRVAGGPRARGGRDRVVGCPGKLMRRTGWRPRVRFTESLARLFSAWREKER